MKTYNAARTTILITAAAVFLATSAARAEDFYKGKTITIVCPYSPGGTYDRMSRLAAKFLPDHIPGKPAAIVQNRPGGGGVIGLRSVYRAKPDGLSLAHFASPMVVRKLNGKIKDIDFEKLTWLGSVGGAHYVFLMRTDRKETTIASLKQTSESIRIGASGPASLLTQAAKFLQRAGKFNIRLVSGYKGFNPMALAMKQNEIDGVATAVATLGVNAVTRGMYKDGTIRMVLSMGGAPAYSEIATKVAALPKFVDMIDDPLDRKAYIAFSGLLNASRPFVATPGLAAERATILQKAMANMMVDPAFVKAATSQGFVLNTLNAKQAQSLILSVFTMPPTIQGRLKTLLK